jgi:hypothetical protein
VWIDDYLNGRTIYLIASPRCGFADADLVCIGPGWDAALQPIRLQIDNVGLPLCPLQACIDPNAEMIQKDQAGDLQQTQRAWERTCKALNDIASRHERSEPEPGANLGIVAPMDHRLGRFKVAA